LKIFVYFIFIIIYSCSEKTSEDKKITNDHYEKAWSYFDKGKNIEAFMYFGKAKDEFLRRKDSLGVGKCLMNMAIIQERMGDYFGSQETAVNALQFFNENNLNDRDYIAANYNNLGIVNNKLIEYDRSINFYEKAIKYSQDSINKIIYFNNSANIYRKKKEYDKAIRILIRLKKLPNLTPAIKSKTIDNLAFTQWLQNPQYNPVPDFQKALKIRLNENDLWGLNSSYAHLADYYTKNNQDSALFYSGKMYEASKKIESPDDQIEALQKLISLESSQNSKQYFKIYQKLNDSLHTARSKAKNQFALIRYETEKNKADFLKAKAESAQKQNYIIKQYFIIGFIISLLIISTLLFKKRQKRLQQEKLLEVKNTELKYSKKVHDKVANRIYQLMSQVENKEVIDRDFLLFGLENAYETSRDISYDNKDINENQSFSEQLHKMLNSYSSESVKFISNGNQEKLWEGVNFQNKTEIYLILQELMTNMKKHSQASIVSIKFSKENSSINISYTDNGIGIKNLSPKNGLQNMENRINVINGTIIFDTETNNLLKINISFPV